MDIFVERTFRVIGADHRECALRFYVPTQVEADFQCRCVITGLGQEKILTVGGVDAIQALMLGMGIARYEVNAYLEDHGLQAEVLDEPSSDVLPELGESGEFSIRTRQGNSAE